MLPCQSHRRLCRSGADGKLRECERERESATHVDNFEVNTGNNSVNDHVLQWSRPEVPSTHHWRKTSCGSVS